MVGPDGALSDSYASALVVSRVSGASWFTALPGWSAYVIEGDTAIAWGPAFDDTARGQES